MTEYLAPGVYIEEVPFKGHPIEGVTTSNAAFIDIFEHGPISKAVKIDRYADFERVFGGVHARSEASYAIRQFYLNGGRVAWVVRVDDPSHLKLTGDAQTGMYALEGINNQVRGAAESIKPGVQRSATPGPCSNKTHKAREAADRGCDSNVNVMIRLSAAPRADPPASAGGPATSAGRKSGGGTASKK